MPAANSLTVGALEYLAHIDVGVEHRAQPGGQTGRYKRVSALVEKTPCDVHGFEVQEFTEYRCDGFFHRVARWPPVRAIRRRLRQSCSVEFAARGDRQCRQRHNQRGHQMSGQLIPQIRYNGVRIVDVWRDVGDQRRSGGQLTQNYCGRADLGSTQQRRFDLARLDAIAAQLYLTVGPTDVPQRAPGTSEPCRRCGTSPIRQRRVREQTWLRSVRAYRSIRPRPAGRQYTVRRRVPSGTGRNELSNTYVRSPGSAVPITESSSLAPERSNAVTCTVVSVMPEHVHGANLAMAVEPAANRAHIQCFPRRRSTAASAVRWTA